jgi:hypothetical protein
MLTITTPASSLQLLTAAQLRTAAGLAPGDASQDTALADTGLRIAADITSACKVAIGAGAEPTLLRETLTETFRGVRSEQLVLARRFGVTITSVTVDDTALAGTEYEVEPESGLLYRLSGNCRVCWAFTKAVVVYAAGFSTVPADLSGAAGDLMRIRVSEAAQNPLVKGESVEVPDVMTRRTDYWVGSVPGSDSGSPVPTEIASRLSRYMNYGIG